MIAGPEGWGVDREVVEDKSSREWPEEVRENKVYNEDAHEKKKLREGLKK